jgi:hypothetical protein
VLAPLLAAALAQAAPLLRVEPAADGGFVAFREGDPTPILGADLYRAALRLDLLDRYESAMQTRGALLVAAGVAAVTGPLVGYIVGESNQIVYPSCVVVPPPPECAPPPELVRENQHRMWTAIGIGFAAGVTLGAGLAWAGLSIHPHLPDYAEAVQIVDRYNLRQRAGGPVAAPPGSGTLRIAPTPGGARVSLELRF